MNNLRNTAALVAFVAMLAGCGGDDSGAPTVVATPSPAPGPAPAPAPGPSPTPGPAPTPTPGPSIACPSTQQQPNAPSAAAVSFAALFGGGASDEMNVAVAAADCSAYVGGRFGSGVTANLRSIGTQTTASSTGVLLRVDHSGRQIAGLRFGDVITDGQARPGSSDIVIASNVGLALVSGDLATTRWSETGNFRRVAIARDGTIAALGGANGKRLSVFAPSGALLFTRDFGDALVEDVAIRSGASGADLRVMVTGMAQRDGGPCTQLQVAWIRAYNGANELAWRGYDWTHAQAHSQQSSCADTRGYRIEMGGDDQLYFAGESAGGNSIFRFQPSQLDANAPNVATDQFNNPFNTASNHITYFARLDPLTGRIDAGSFVLARLSSGRGNTIRPRAITADAAGRVYVAGVSAASIQNRDALRLNGEELAAYSGGDAYFLVVSRDLRTRLQWNVLSNGGNGEVRAIGVNGSTAVIASRADTRSTTTGTSLFTTSGAQNSFTGAQAAHAALLPAWQ